MKIFLVEVESGLVKLFLFCHKQKEAAYPAAASMMPESENGTSRDAPATLRSFVLQEFGYPLEITNSDTDG